MAFKEDILFVTSLKSTLFIIKKPVKIDANKIKPFPLLKFIYSPFLRVFNLSINNLLITAKLSKILPPKTITAAIYIGIPSLSPK